MSWLKHVVILQLVLFPSLLKAQDNDNETVIGVQVVNASDLYDSLKDTTNKLPTRKGVIVYRILPNSPAVDAGIAKGDVLTEFNKIKIESSSEFMKAIKSAKAGQSYKMVGYTATPGRPNKQVKWKRGSVEVTPTTRKKLVLGLMKKDKDEFTGVSSWQYINALGLLARSRSIDVWFVEKDGTFELKIRNRYFAEDWIFMKQIIFKTGEKSTTFDVKNRSTEVGGGGVWEWETRSAGKRERELLDDILANEKCTIRYVGDQYKTDRELRDSERELITYVLEAYRILGGK